jgi:hypothetical protein
MGRESDTEASYSSAECPGIVRQMPIEFSPLRPLESSPIRQVGKALPHFSFFLVP